MARRSIGVARDPIASVCLLNMFAPSTPAGRQSFPLPEIAATVPPAAALRAQATHASLMIVRKHSASLGQTYTKIRLNHATLGFEQVDLMRPRDHGWDSEPKLKLNCHGVLRASRIDGLIRNESQRWSGKWTGNMSSCLPGHLDFFGQLQTSRLGVNETDACPPGEKIVLSHPYDRLDGFAYKAAAPSLSSLSDTETDLFRSPTLLCENKMILGPPHSFHADIVKDGWGRFSHYGDGVVFSASDNSNPNSNGRQYTIVVPTGKK